MRAFISIEIPNEIKKKIVNIRDSLPKFKGKKTETDNLHLTLKFLGEVNYEKIGKIREKLKEIEFKKFEAEIDSIGVFSEKFIKIIWLHIKNCDGLQREIDNKLKDLFEKEKRFMSHLTIARIKSIKDKKRFLEKLKKVEISKMKFIVNNFNLKKSILTEKGPIYENLETYNLKI